MPATGAMLLIPAMTNFDVLSPNPPNSAAINGIAISATRGDIFFVRITASNRTIVARPSNASIAILR